VNLQNKQAALKSLLEVLKNELLCLEAGTNLFENGAVLNIRKHTGYIVELSFE
jgi:hypothetical protein